MNVLSALVLALSLAPGSELSLAQSESTASRMREIVRRVVAETGEQIIGVGSWISRANYRDPLTIASGSDHDMRLLIPRGTSEAAAVERWNKVRQALVKRIQSEFGAQAPKVLSSTNLYAPAQLMRGVENQADAMARFVKLKQVPNLGYRGTVNSSTPMKLAEGLFGQGAEGWTQDYERAAGRIFYQQNNKVYEGLTDLTHLGEGQARFTIAGSAHTAGEWVLHADDALRNGDATSLAKYLSRVERDLTKARDLARLPTGTSTSRELKALASRLRAGERLGDLRPLVDTLLRKAHLESALVGRFGRAGTLQKAVLRVAVDGLEAGNSLGKALSNAAGKLPPERVVQGLVLAVMTYSTAKYAGEEEYHAAFANVAGTALGLGPAILLLVSQSVVDAAREGGYSLVAGRQSAFDLIEGVFSAGEVAKTRYTLDQLVTELHTEELLKAFVLVRAYQAADRGFGEASGRHDMKTAEAIFAKCYPIILAAWRDKRESLEVEFLDLYDGLSTGGVLLAYEPTPAPAPSSGAATTVTVSLHTVDPKDGDRMARMRAILATLFGAKQGTYANVLTRWTPAGTEANYGHQRRFQFAQPGKHLVEVEQTLSFGAAGLPRTSPLNQTLKRQAMVDILVGGAAAKVVAPPVGGRIAGTYPEPPKLGLSIAYQIEGLQVTKTEDQAKTPGTGFDTSLRRIRTRVPLGPVTARGNVKFAGQSVRFGPTSMALVTLQFVFYVAKPGSEAQWQKRAAELKAAGRIPEGYVIGHGGTIQREWRTSATLSPGKSLAFDFAADLSWVNRLPADMKGAYSLELAVKAGLNQTIEDVAVVVGGQGER